MTYGPIDILALEFPDNAKLQGEALAALVELVENRMIRIIDLVIVQKNAEGQVISRELQELDPRTLALLDPLKATVTSLVTANDIQIIAESLDNNSTAAVLLWENLWAIKFKEAILKADARLIMQERIPQHVVVEELADIAVLASKQA